eukprot:TRINITY_DN6077_c0_g2_i1.p1 TRINITY_DN6077_c0_g2~~TRINITY_DN6077_c0_g2_i1.p1  ORF type:complete len:320 (+),score=110.93 TRINITY_DN6077_c0_g2_i1:104-1063(+)
MAGAPPGLSPAPGLAPPPGALMGANGCSGAEEAGGPDLRQEVSAKIAAQVQSLLLQAKKESEQKVTAELKLLHSVMQEMDARLDNITKQLDELPQQSRPAEAMEQAAVVQALAKVEQQWGKELRKLKGELHQTIFAHNHNADLMRHQKETLDNICKEIGAHSNSDAASAKVQVAKEQLAKVQNLQKGALKQKKLEPLVQRMAALEQKIAATASWRWQGSMMGQNAAAMAAGFSNPALASARSANMLAAMAKQSNAAAALAVQAQAAQAAQAAHSAQAANFYGGMESGGYLGEEAAAAEGEEDEETLESVLAKALAATGI